MAKLEWLKEYSGQTTEELLALEGVYRTDSLVVAFHQAIDQKAFKKGDDSLSQEEQIVPTIEALQTEVNNGGFSQFFINYSREYAPVILSC
jgi:hypothetical protein